MKIEWRRVPWTVWAFVAVAVGRAALDLFATGGFWDHIVPLLFAYMILTRTRWAWLCWIGVTALLVVGLPLLSRGSWLETGSEVVQLVLLILPVTRGYFAQEPQRVAAT